MKKSRFTRKERQAVKERQRIKDQPIVIAPVGTDHVLLATSLLYYIRPRRRSYP